VGEVSGDEGRGTGCISADAWTLQTEGVGDAASGVGRTVACCNDCAYLVSKIVVQLQRHENESGIYFTRMACHFIIIHKFKRALNFEPTYTIHTQVFNYCILT